MQTITKRIILRGEDRNDDIEEQIRLLKEDVDAPNLSHGKPMEPLPDWFDPEKYRRGQEFFHRNYFALFVSKLCGLFVILSIPRVQNILTMTQKSSSPATAFKRYLSTLSHMLTWYNGDVRDKESLAYKSLREVHMKHAAANRRGLSEKMGSLSQSSLAITQFGFMGFGVLTPEKLGLYVIDEKDFEGFVHFWRVVGYLIGVEDKYNICRGSVEETKATCKRILEDILWPHLKSPSQVFLDMTKALLEGMWVMVPFLDVEAFTAFTNDLSGLEIKPFTNWWSWGVYNFQKFAHWMLNSVIFGGIWRAFVNFQMWSAVVISNKFPFLSYFTFGYPKPSKLDSP